ncbi:hypothetical protein QR680_010777 [Steinernema hermaphroditum]|uniref:Uncharacterized protein n=1 Tax=Steinernema hermaphroditum TaxID=289476 RepID=A0AA39ISI6_9BILA|nr:hypothetical protein QR680_010777 [Steinernema hermaphroditum]
MTHRQDSVCVVAMWSYVETHPLNAFRFLPNALRTSGRLNMEKEERGQAAKDLTGSSEMTAENIRLFSIAVWKGEEDQWFCKITETIDEDLMVAISLEEFYSIDRRSVRICDVTVCKGDYRGVSYAMPVAISKEHLIKDMIPFLNAQSLPSCELTISEWSAEYMAVFKSYVVFGRLHLHLPTVLVPDEVPHNPQHSEDFLANQIEKNCMLNSVKLSNCPHSEKLEDLLLDLLKKRNKIRLEVAETGKFVVTMRIVNAVFKMWHETGNRTEIKGKTNITEEELLSMPLPEGVTRIEKCVEGGFATTYNFIWNQESTPDLKCKLVVGKGWPKGEGRTLCVL